MLRPWRSEPGNSRCSMWGNTEGARDSTGGAEFASRETGARRRPLDRWCTLKESVKLERDAVAAFGMERKPKLANTLKFRERSQGHEGSTRTNASASHASVIL
jgi:hypothetical protein